MYVAGLDERVTEALLWELFLQCGPVSHVYVPKDSVTSVGSGFGFVEFETVRDAQYALKRVMNMIKLFGSTIVVKSAKKGGEDDIDIGANLFIGQLAPEVDEKVLYDTFSAFGTITKTPKIMRDTETDLSRGFAFLSFSSFRASDLAIECLNGQYLCGKQIVVQYAYKKETAGERDMGARLRGFWQQSGKGRLRMRQCRTPCSPGGVRRRI